jgi:hypothetical protein
MFIKTYNPDLLKEKVMFYSYLYYGKFVARANDGPAVHLVIVPDLNLVTLR